MTVSVPYIFENNTLGDGTEVNANFDALVEAFDGFLPLDGGTLSGMLYLPATTPTDNNHAANKKYVDDTVGAYTIGTGAVTAAKLATDAVETAKIKDDAVTAAKLADASVDLGSAAITGSLPLSRLENAAYTTFTPQLKQTVSVSQTVNWAAWRREGRRVVGYFKITPTSGGTSNTVVTVTASALPLPLHAGAVGGSGFYLNNGSDYITLVVRVNVVSGVVSFDFIGNDSTTDLFGKTPGMTVGAGTEYISVSFDYEAAS